MSNFRKNKVFLRLACLVVVCSFLSNAVLPAYARAELGLPAPGQFVNLSQNYSFPALKAIKFNPANPLELEFIIDTADQKNISEEEAGKLVKYFLAGLTVPEEELWVNMSPYEKDRIIPQGLSQTDLGKDLLSQDYILKQISSSITYPESQTGKDFWTKVYSQVYKAAHTTKVPVNTFNKIWIVPEKAVVYENQNLALISEATLKTMLEEDYLALEVNSTYAVKDAINTAKPRRLNTGLSALVAGEINRISSGVMKELILPKINQEVNSGKNFATLRQIYHSLVLASWFKKKFKDSLYSAYINQNKTQGIDLSDKDAKDKIYNLYVQAFSKGIYNYIKTDTEPQTGKRIKRQYLSGGVNATNLAVVTQNKPVSQEIVSSAISRDDKIMTVRLNNAGQNNDNVSSAMKQEGIYSLHNIVKASSVEYYKEKIKKENGVLRYFINIEKDHNNKIYKLSNWIMPFYSLLLDPVPGYPVPVGIKNKTEKIELLIINTEDNSLTIPPENGNYARKELSPGKMRELVEDMALVVKKTFFGKIILTFRVTKETLQIFQDAVSILGKNASNIKFVTEFSTGSSPITGEDILQIKEIANIQIPPAPLLKTATGIIQRLIRELGRGADVEYTQEEMIFFEKFIPSLKAIITLENFYYDSEKTLLVNNAIKSLRLIALNGSKKAFVALEKDYVILKEKNGLMVEAVDLVVLDREARSRKNETIKEIRQVLREIRENIEQKKKLTLKKVELMKPEDFNKAVVDFLLRALDSDDVKQRREVFMVFGKIASNRPYLLKNEKIKNILAIIVETEADISVRVSAEGILDMLDGNMKKASSALDTSLVKTINTKAGVLSPDAIELLLKTGENEAQKSASRFDLLVAAARYILKLRAKQIFGLLQRAVDIQLSRKGEAGEDKLSALLKAKTEIEKSISNGKLGEARGGLVHLFVTSSEETRGLLISAANDLGINLASSAMTGDAEKIASPAFGEARNDTATGGINMRGIDVAQTGASSPMNFPAIDLKNITGLTFRIVKIEDITDPIALANRLVPAEAGIMAQQQAPRQAVAYLKN